jgi:ATP-dependent RNA helicase DDX3X
MSDFGDTHGNGDANGAHVTDSGANGDGLTQKQKELAETLAALKDKGWENPIPFNYPTVPSGAAPEDVGRDDAPWLGNAAVYEWNDEYGEIGPEDKQLEEVLFHGEYAMKAGNRIKALDFDVGVFGPEKVPPFRSVCFVCCVTSTAAC